MDIRSIHTSDTHNGGSFGRSIDLSGDSRLPKDIIASRKQPVATNPTLPEGAFANPSKNVHRIGLREGMRVADFGSGSGVYTLALAELVGPSGEVYAVDVQKDLLTRVQNNAIHAGYDTVHTVWGDIDSKGSVGIRDELLDAVLISNTLFQTEYKNIAIQQAWRVLKQGGLLAIIDWTESYGGIGPQQNDIIGQAEAVIIASDNGFSLKHEFDAGAHHYGLIFQKVALYQLRNDGMSTDTIKTNESKVSQVSSEEKNFITKTISQELL